MIHLPTHVEDALEGHVTRCALSTYVRLAVVRSKDAVLDGSAHETVGLAVPGLTYQVDHSPWTVSEIHGHRLWPQCRGDQVYLPATQLILQGFLCCGTPFGDLHLDARIFLWADALTISTVVVHTGLAVFRAVDGVAFAEFDLSQRVELVHLPAHKCVVIRVRWRRHERTTPVYTRPQGVMVCLFTQMFGGKCGERGMTLTIAIGGK